MQTFEKDPKKSINADDMALVRAHLRRLAQAARNVEVKFGTVSQEYVTAWKARSDWAARIKPMQTEWSKSGQAQQGAQDIDTGTFTGMQEAYRDDTGKDFTPSQAKVAKTLSGNVREAAEETAKVIPKLAEIYSKEPEVDPIVKRVVDRMRQSAHKMRDTAMERIKARQAQGAMFSGVPLNPEVIDDLAQVGYSHLVDGAATSLEWGNKMVESFGEKIKPYLDDIWKRTEAIFNEQTDKEAGLKAAPKVKRAIKKVPAQTTIEGVRNAVAGHKAGTPFTPEQVKGIWNLAKAELDKGEMDLVEIRNKLAKDLGLPAKEVTKALAQPKGAKRMSDELYSKMSNQRRLVNNAKTWLKNAQYPGWLRFVRSVPRIFFAAKVMGHGTVAFGTHAPAMAFNPHTWGYYFSTFVKMYGMVAKPAYHERMMQELAHDKYFIEARRSGLANDPYRYQDDYQNPAIQQYFGKFTGMGNRGFDALKILRQARYNQLRDTFPDAPEGHKLLSDLVNHSTGVIKAQPPTALSVGFFAPKLEGSRWMFMFGDTGKTGKIFANWHNETPETKAFAMADFKQKAAMIGSYFGLLAMNQGILSAMGSKQKVNWTNPRKSDFLEFKVAGYNVGVASAMIRTVRFIGSIYHDATAKRTKFEQLKGSRREEMGGDIWSYAGSKVSPFGGFGGDVISSADFQGRPLPWSSDPTPKWLRKRGEGKYGYGEYAAEQFTPIPLEEALKEVWKAQGMNETQIEEWTRVLSIAVPMATTGVRVSKDYPKK